MRCPVPFRQLASASLHLWLGLRAYPATQGFVLGSSRKLVYLSASRQPLGLSHYRSLLSRTRKDGKSGTTFLNSFIGVDYGEKRVGLAVTIGVAPRPSIRIENTGNHTLLAQSIIKVAAREGASRIIVGFPLEKNGTEGVMSDTVRVFSQTLADDWHVSAWGSKFNDVESGVVLWDERYSSWEAKTRLKENYDISSGTIDIMSAICILEHYLEEGGKGSEVVKPSQKARKLRHKAKSTIRK